MVGLEKYFTTFTSVMPERIKNNKKILQEKNELDRLLAQKKDVSIIIQLKKIVGEDSLFRKAYTDGQSLRYNIRKYKKSFDFMKQEMGSFLADVDQKTLSELKKLGIDLPKMAESLIKISQNASSFADTLDIIYFQEYFYLKSNNIEQYLLETAKEQQIIRELQKYSRNIEHKIKQVWKSIESTSQLSKWNDSWNPSAITLILNGVFILGITAGFIATFGNLMLGIGIVTATTIIVKFAKAQSDKLRVSKKKSIVEGLLANII